MSSSTVYTQFEVSPFEIKRSSCMANNDSLLPDGYVSSILAQGGIMTGNLGTMFQRNLHPQPKYCVELPLFEKICKNMNVFELKMIK